MLLISPSGNSYVQFQESLLQCNVYSSQITFIYIAFFTIQIVTKQLYRNNRKLLQKCLFPEKKSMTVQLKFSDVSFFLVNNLVHLSVKHRTKILNLTSPMKQTNKLQQRLLVT